jgi:hypothetical protein
MEEMKELLQNLFMYEMFIAWLIVGFLSSFIAILVFRGKDATVRKELFLAVAGPLFGPIVFLMMFVDLIKRFFGNGVAIRRSGS